MTAKRWAEIEELFHRAAECNGVERDKLLQDVGYRDPELRRELETLLSCAHEAGANLKAAIHAEVEAFGTSEARAASETKSLTNPSTVSDPDSPERRYEGNQHWRQIGRYRILGVLGEGGMGVVYEAELDQPCRTVALKVMKPGLASAALERRFQRESHALGKLQHPGIAQITKPAQQTTGPARNRISRWS